MTLVIQPNSWPGLWRGSTPRPSFKSMIKKKYKIWYENSMKLNNEGWNYQKNNQPRRELKIKGNCNHKIDD